MASTRISTPMRGATHQLSRLQIRQDALSSRCTKGLSTPFARSITTSRSPQASLSPITTSATEYIPLKPLSEQTVLATIHRFPSLEPLRFETYPANDLNLPLRRDILHRAVIYEGDMTRLGTASTKTRHEVRGSARKIRPQKGSGRARLGDKKSPMLRGGGVAFGPKPRDFATELPKKVYDLAWRTALSHRFRKGDLFIVDNAMEIESPSTRLLLDILKYQESLQGRGRNLFITSGQRPLLEDALDQLGRGEETLTWEEVDVKNILEQQRIVIERAALHQILAAHQEHLTRDLTEHKYRPIKGQNDLEQVTGWSEFRALQLSTSPTTDRPAAYESVANKRYKQAKPFPPGPQRTTLKISAYTLLAEAKQLHFETTTGMSWSEYTNMVSKDLERSTITAEFPRIQQLTYQQSIKQKLADNAAELSRLESEIYEFEANSIDVEKMNLRLEASLLAAQVYEHEAEALRLQGDKSVARGVLELASELRTEVGDLEFEILEARLALGVLDVRIQSAKGNVGAQRSAEKEVERLQKEVDEVRARMEAEAAVEEAAEEGVDGEVVQDLAKIEAEKK